MTVTREPWVCRRRLPDGPLGGSKLWDSLIHYKGHYFCWLPFTDLTTVIWEPCLCRRRLPDGPLGCAGTGKPVLDILSQTALDSFQDLFINYCHICLFLATVTITRGDLSDSVLRLWMSELGVCCGPEWRLKCCGNAVKLLHIGRLGWILAKDQGWNQSCLSTVCCSSFARALAEVKLEKHDKIYEGVQAKILLISVLLTDKWRISSTYYLPQ